MKKQKPEPEIHICQKCGGYHAFLEGEIVMPCGCGGIFEKVGTELPFF